MGAIFAIGTSRWRVASLRKLGFDAVPGFSGPDAYPFAITSSGIHNAGMEDQIYAVVDQLLRFHIVEVLVVLAALISFALPQQTTVAGQTRN